jgi:hypothetical protein
MLFGSDGEPARRLAEEVRKKLVSAMWDGFGIQEWAERRDFGPNAFFLKCANGTWKPPDRITDESMSALVRDGKPWAQFETRVKLALEDAVEATVENTTKHTTEDTTENTTEATTEAVASDTAQLSRQKRKSPGVSVEDPECKKVRVESS